MPSQKVGCGLERWHQFRLLTKKNFLLLLRNKISSVVQILVPILFILLLFLLALAQRDNDKYNPNQAKYPVSEPLALNQLPRCRVGEGKERCWTVGYTQAGDPVVDAVMATLISQNGLTSDDVLSFSTESESDNFLLTNPNTTQGVYQFNVDYGCDLISTEQSVIDACYAAPHTLSQVRGLKYVVQYNQTSIYEKYNEIDTYTGIYLPYLNAIERAIFNTLGGGLDYDFSVSKFAHPALPRFNIVALVGPSVIFAAIMFNMVIQAGLIVAEKELKLRESMRVMGLIDGVYWASWIVLNVVMNVLAAFLLIAAGQIFRLPLFVKNDFGTYAVLLILFAISMVPIGLLLSVLVDQASTATTAGFAVYLVGSLIQSFSGILYLESSGTAAATAFSLFPFVVFGKGIADLAAATTNEYQAGIRWSARFNNDWWPMQKTYYFLIGDFFIYLFIALYLDNVIYSKRPFYFFLTKSYWFGVQKRSAAKKSKSAKKQKKATKAGAYEVDMLDDDVEAEEMMVASGDVPASKAVVLDRLSMTYSTNRYLCCGNVSFRAVKDVSVTMDAGQLFCLLGHNGAGKSTTIGMLTGLLTPTGGDATILGHSIIDSMDQIRENMGVCPQHDVLWPQLTAREHLELYAGFKRLYGDDMLKDVAERLEDVALTAAADTPCGNYSGGMKRRLSVSIALIGDPKIVFLDEPTTGMDPVSRRQVWNLIERVKRGRVTLLTTHSMEEADVLGDRITIMKGGRLAALGSSMQLKRKFGTGYSVNVLSKPELQDQLHEHVLGYFEGKVPDSSSSSSAMHEMDSSAPSPSSSSTHANQISGSTAHAEPNGKTKATREKAAQDDHIEVIGTKHDKVANSEDIEHTEEDDGTVKRTLKEGPVSQYQVPLAYHDYLSDFFRSLDAAKQKLGISNVQLAMTTLEDVFLRVAEKGEHAERKKALTPEQKAKRRRRRCTIIFWSVFVVVLLLGFFVAIGLGLSTKKTKDVPTASRSGEPPMYEPTTGTLDIWTFPSAIQITDVRQTSVLLSAYVTSNLALSIQLMQGSDSGWTSVPAIGIARDANNLGVNSLGRAQDGLIGLSPDTVYNVWLEAGNGSRSEVTRFRTATAHGSELRNVTLGATSSFGKSGRPYPSLDCAAAYNLDAFMILGDSVFSDPGDDTPTRVEEYNQLFKSSGFSKLTRSTSFITTWNDQEVAQGWKQNASNPALQADIDSAISAFENSFPYNPGPGAALSTPAEPLSDRWRSIAWGDNLEVFVLDLQFERNSTQLVSVQQMDWLKNSLRASTSKFKIIMSSISFTDTSPLLIRVANSWIAAPEAQAQREELIDWIVNNRIEGVLFVSGGSQFGMVAHAESTPDPKKAPEWSRWNITESLVGPAGTFINPQVRFNSRIAFASKQFLSIVDTFNTVVYNFDPGKGWVDIKYLDDKCLVAYSESFKIVSTPKKK
jgi:ABC-type multidrug transport system ATPase subunit